MKITVLAGGVGGSRFALGVREWMRQRAAGDELTVVANTGDDLWLTGLRITPDLDSLLYALAGVNDTERGWGRAGETERVSAELTAFGVGWPWFTLGDLDLGTHIARTALLREGMPLHAVVERLAARWDLGARLLPATDDEVETHVRLSDGTAPHFEEWWVRLRAQVPAVGFEQRGVDTARPAPGVLDAIRDADLVLLAPSNPVVSIGTILGIPGIADAVRATAAPVVGLSPVIGGAVLRGMADACLAAIGVETSADAVARHYGSRATGGVLDGWLVDTADSALVPGIEQAGIRSLAVPLYMTDPATTARMVQEAVDLAAG